MKNPADVFWAREEAWRRKDSAAMGKILHPQYVFTGPLMKIEGREESLAAMQDFPFEERNENSELIVEGNKIVHIYDWVVTSPFVARIPMVEIIEVESLLIKSVRLFFDTGRLPADIRAQIASAD